MLLKFILCGTLFLHFGQCQEELDPYKKVGSATLKQAVAQVVIQPFIYPLNVFDALKQQLQKPYSQLIRERWSQGGIREFYTGLSFDALRLVAVKSHKTPLALFVESQWKKHIEETNLFFPACCAASFAFLETTFINPLERLRIERITTNPTERNTIFYKRPISDYYSGFSSSFYRQFFSAFAFFYSEKFAKRITTGDPLARELTIYQLILVSTIMACFHTLMTQPFELVKTLKQQKNPRTGNTFEIWKDMISQHGCRSLYAGGAANTMAYMIRYPVTLYFLDYSRRHFHKKHNHLKQTNF